MLLGGLPRHGGEEPARATGPAATLGDGHDELGLLEHQQVGPDGVRMQAEIGRELVRRARPLARPEVLEQPHPARIGERPVLDDFPIHGPIFPNLRPRSASADSLTGDRDPPRCQWLPIFPILIV